MQRRERYEETDEETNLCAHYDLVLSSPQPR